MAKFRYTAIDTEGNQKTGRVTADSPEEANEKLEANGFFVQELEEEVKASRKAGRPQRGGRGKKASQAAGEEYAQEQVKKKKKKRGGKVSKEELTAFTRQTATLLNAGLPLLRSLEVMIRQAKNPKFKDILEGLADYVRSGNSFSDGLETNPKLFDNLYINMVRAGEAGGVLEIVLDRLANFMEKAEKTRKKVKSAMTYPVVVVTVAVLVVGVLMVFVVPQFEAIFRGHNLDDIAKKVGGGQ